eukprot:762961-Hanusia_phi.AAC.13
MPCMLSSTNRPSYESPNADFHVPDPHNLSKLSDKAVRWRGVDVRGGDVRAEGEVEGRGGSKECAGFETASR